jgi:hypothetical protein
VPNLLRLKMGNQQLSSEKEKVQRLFPKGSTPEPVEVEDCLENQVDDIVYAHMKV